MTSLLLRVLMIAAMASFVAGCKSTPTKRSAAEYAEDAAITARVKLALANAPNVKATEIKVETFRGVVQLSGFVDTPEMAQGAEQAARQVSGVRDVKNDLRLRPPPKS